MRTCRINVIGASGTGVASLGRALADALALPHHDTDDYFWQPTNATVPAEAECRRSSPLMREVLLDRADWVLSGSVEGWGDSIIPLLDLVVFISAPNEVRLQRLRDREARHFGVDTVAPGGWRHEETEELIDWASHYDDGSREGKNLARHQAWLALLPCRTIHLNSTRPIHDLVNDVIAAIAA